MKKPNENWFSRFKKDVRSTQNVFILIAALVGGIFAVNRYIDYRIKNKINDDKFLEELSYILRPSVVFDQNNSILAKMGAMKYIEDINVVVEEGEPKKIVLSPKDLLNVAPLLECLDGDFEIIVNRGKKYDWEYELKHVSSLLLEESKGQITNHRFRIEIIR